MTNNDNDRRDDVTRAVWRHSTRTSGGGNGQCVEAAGLRAGVAVRDSKLAAEPGFPVLRMGRADWAGFLAAVRTTP